MNVPFLENSLGYRLNPYNIKIKMYQKVLKVLKRLIKSFSHQRFLNSSYFLKHNFHSKKLTHFMMVHEFDHDNETRHFSNCKKNYILETVFPSQHLPSAFQGQQIISFSHSNTLINTPSLANFPLLLFRHTHTHTHTHTSQSSNEPQMALII